MPVTKRSNGSYQVTIGFGGRTYRKTSGRWTYAEARAHERKWLAALKDEEAGKQPDRLIEDAIEKWLSEHVPRLRSAQKTRNHVAALWPYVRGRKLSDVPKVWAEIKAAEKNKAPATVNHKGRVLRQISRAAWREWGWLERPAAISLLTEQHRERFLSVEEVRLLAKHCQHRATRGYLLLAAYTGIRRGHLLRLTSKDLVGDADFISLDRSSKTRGLQLIPVHKAVKPIARRLPLGSTSRLIQEDWDRARRLTGIDCRWHDLRHTCASWLVQEEVPLHTVAEILGHSSIAVTRRYAHLAPRHLTNAIAKLK